MGYEVFAHDELYTATTQDVEWLGRVGREGWLALSKDGRIRYNSLERQQLIEARVYFFLVPDGQMRGEEQRALVTSNLDRIVRVARKLPPPLVAKLARNDVSVLEGGRWIAASRAIRAHMASRAAPPED